MLTMKATRSRGSIEFGGDYLMRTAIVMARMRNCSGGSLAIEFGSGAAPDEARAGLNQHCDQCGVRGDLRGKAPRNPDNP